MNGTPVLCALVLLLAAGPRTGESGRETVESATRREGKKANSELRTARRYYESKVADNANDADSWHGLAVVLRRSEMHADAVLAMTRAVEIAPTAERHRELGLILRLAGEEERGINHLVESVRGGALSPTALLMIGRFQHYQGHYAQAVRTLVLALRLTDPALSGGHAIALTMCLLDANRYLEAEVAFRGAARDRLLLPAPPTSLSSTSSTSTEPNRPPPQLQWEHGVRTTGGRGGGGRQGGQVVETELEVNSVFGLVWRRAALRPLEDQVRLYEVEARRMLL